ncbi:MAG: ATP synthase subunit I [Firmicutes bacterium]|nr:ATP synthase subunit I [Bacillota bacterium]
MNISITCKRIIFLTAAFGLIFFGIGVFLTDNALFFAKGIIFGTVFSILKVILLEKTLKKAVNMGQANAQNYTRLHYSLRYFLTGVVVVVAALVKSISLLGVVLGLAAMTPAVFIAGKMENNGENAENV